MEVEEMEMSKMWRMANGGEGMMDEDDDGETEEGVGLGGVVKEGKSRLLAWHSSRIFRVSRASGGKDRHSKVLTAKGLRDRRVRLSVSTAIQFYDLQDRLGYDQPSKAVEWLIKAAAKAIAKLPPLDGTFLPSPKEEESDREKRIGPDAETEPSAFLTHQHRPYPLTNSTCSSTSDTCKGSVLSLSRSEIRVKARERARERTAKEKEKEKDNENESNLPHQHDPSPNTHGSFTDLLSSCNGSASGAAIPTATSTNSDFIAKQFRHFPSMDYFGPAAIFGPLKSEHDSGFSVQPQIGNPPLTDLPISIATSGNPVDHHPDLPQFAALQDHLIHVPAAATTATNDPNLDFSISSNLAGFNRGTLQSNSPSPLSPHMQRFPASVVEAPPHAPFFTGATTFAAAENHFPAGFDSGLHLYYGDDGCRHSDRKGKGKS